MKSKRDNTTDSSTDPASDQFSFVAAEHQVLDDWHREKVFEASLAKTENGKPYIFYDGPPFATGLPHHGHLVGSILKDAVPRYWTMKGRHVQRRFGWDCHGLPIEHEIDKSLGMSSREAVAKLGVKGYNDECRKIVQRYTSEWRKTITRIGRWVDFDHDYKTMEPWYMESVWWVVKQLWSKDLIYRGEKVVPFSTALGTVLSNFEAGSNYQAVQDPAITVLFKLKSRDAYIAIWTTTPWTLPSNLALCVGADIDYVEAFDEEQGINLIIAEERLEAIGKHHKLRVERSFKGSDLVGEAYEPLFDYFADKAAEGAFVVLADDYVSTESGTGIVHQAPAFGEDDFRIMKAAGIAAMVCPVDMQGRFTEEVSDLAGLHVKEADKQIIQMLKDQALKDGSRLYIQDVIVHNYPFCPRSHTPIIYRTIDSWYVKVEQMRDALLQANQGINWVPEHLREGRMGNWLAGAIDWAISRNRYWGTPLPIWINDETGKQACIGSRQELEELTGAHPDDLHRENVDELTFSIDGEPGTYRRIEEVLDCWFESGSMPYAQLHYPFENEAVFEQGFPAEFIAEGLDQTRGWFYTLIVLGTALYGTTPFKNVIVNGIVMAEDGKKMAKSLRNYSPPDELMETYGADALRLYLINSGLVRAEEQRFADSGVKDMVRRALLPWLNAYRFLQTYAEIDGWQVDDMDRSKPISRRTEKALDLLAGRTDNIMDQWLLSRLETLKSTISEEMQAYRLYNVVPALFDFIEDLTNWYIRLNRGRFWAEGLKRDKRDAYQTLYLTLRELCLAMAPFAPFLAETIFKGLSHLEVEPSASKDEPTSVHLCSYPEPNRSRAKESLEDAVALMQQIIVLGRRKRNQEKVKIKYPLAELKIIHRDQALLDEIAQLETYIQAELNVKTISYEQDERQFIQLTAKPNSPVLGKRLGKRFGEFRAKIESLGSQAINQYQAEGRLLLDGETFGPDDILVFREAREGTNALSNSHISIDLDCTLNDALKREGLAREAVRHIQESRKDAGLHVADRISLKIGASKVLADAMTEHRKYIERETLATEWQLEQASGKPETQGFHFDIDGEQLGFELQKVEA